MATVVFLHDGGDKAAGANAQTESFVNFETTAVHPIDLSPDRTRLAVCNVPDGKLEIFDATVTPPILLGSVPVGLDPVTARFRHSGEVWVANYLSDSVSVIEVASLRVVATLDTRETPADVVFAGQPARAFVSCSRPNLVQKFNPESRQLVTNLMIDAERPRALAVSLDGQKVYAAIFESGNATTIIGAKFKNLLFIENVVGLTNAPSAGHNPVFNSADAFSPPLNPSLPSDLPPPGSGLIVRKNEQGRWLDDTQRDWTEFVSGTNASLTQRVAGWDLPDRDLAVIDATTGAISYVTGLMNICMALAVHPVSGQVAVVGTDARNEVRFEPNLNGRFVHVNLALADPSTGARTIHDLNPHLNYSSPITSAAERNKSIGDPRAIAWTADGSRAYVAGLGSRNLAVIDANGHRASAAPIEVGEGPCGLAIDDSRGLVYVYHRFSSSVSVVRMSDDTVVAAIPLFDPTPLEIAAGRKHLYDTRRTSGLGQASCASCHVDARLDRLAWDLGNPAGDLSVQVLNQRGALVTNTFHPMKGVMVTQTLQDIIGHEPFHWRGDRPDLESFTSTYTNLQGAASALSTAEMRELRDFLSGVRLPPSRVRSLDNSLPTNLPLPGHFASGQGTLPAGAPLPNGNAVAGIAAFNLPVNFCNTCHTLPTGLGLDGMLDNGVFKPLLAGTNGAHHFPLNVRLEGSLLSKNAQFRNLADRIGMDTTRATSRSGFGFGHDGSVDSLTRFLGGLRVVNDQQVANLIALLLSVSGSDLHTPDAIDDPTPPAAVGRQLTLSSSLRPPSFDTMLALARSATSRVDLIAKGRVNGETRGWYFDRTIDRFQSDRQSEILTVDALLGTAGPGSELTVTVVCRGTGRRLGIDRDLDGVLDRDELDAGTNPATRLLRPRVLAECTAIPIGSMFSLEARLPPLASPGVLAWFKNSELLVDQTNQSLILGPASFDSAAEYSVRITTTFETLRSDPVSIHTVPLLVMASPSNQLVRQGSNGMFTATFIGDSPLSYQWQFNEQEILGATGSMLVVSNVQLASEGLYRVVAANASGSATSAPVRLEVAINPSIVTPPLSQNVVEGGQVTFSFQIAGNPPPFGFQLFRSSTLLTNYVTAERTGFLSLADISVSDAGTYRIMVTNAANPSPGLALGPILLGVLADFDHDGLPDGWEVAHGFNTNNAADATQDFDLDGASNRQEYLAGTDPLTAGSRLSLDATRVDDHAIVLRFFAASNHTYSLQHRSPIDANGWLALSHFAAQATNRWILWTNQTSEASERYFRVATP